MPLGFVSDHMEVLWDLDEEALATAREAGMHAERVPTPGIHAAFVSGLVDLVGERLLLPAGAGASDGAARGADGVTPVTVSPAAAALSSTGIRPRPALTPLGPWYDVCRPGCCANPRGPKPAVSGLAP